MKNEETGQWEERWTGDYIFENEWQSFRTKKDRSLELTSVFHECTPGRRKIAVKVVDIFGNDTMTIVDVNVGEQIRPLCLSKPVEFDGFELWRIRGNWIISVILPR